jgi:hypothetical protein
LEASTTSVLLEAAQEASNAKIMKKFSSSKAARIETPLLEAAERDDDLDCGQSAPGAVYSALIDNRMKEINQINLNSLKPLIHYYQAVTEPKQKKKLRKVLAVTSAMVFKASNMSRRTRLAFILRQNYPKLCKTMKVDVLTKKLSQEVEQNTERPPFLAGDNFSKKLKDLRKIDLATKEFSGPTPQPMRHPATQASQQPMTSRQGTSFSNNWQQKNPRNNVQRNPHNNFLQGGTLYENMFHNFFSECESSWLGVVPGGRLAKARRAWQAISNNPWVLETSKGYSLCFQDKAILPTQIECPELPMNTDKKEFMDKEIRRLLDNGFIRDMNRENLRVICSLFLVPKGIDSFRLVHNLKPLNKFLAAPHFKMEGYHSLFPLLERNVYFVKIDLSDAYLSVPMNPDCYQFLGFSWRGKYYAWTSLPFGLNQAPWVFTKLLRSVVKFFRALIICLLIYLDDLLLFHHDPSVLKDQVAFVIRVLEVLGFVVNKKKSILEPSKQILFLGFTLDSEQLQLSVPNEKIVSFQAELSNLLKEEPVTLRSISSLIGRMNSFCVAMLPGHLHFRQVEGFLQQQLAKHGRDYNANCSLSPEVRKELLWWQTNFHKFNGRAIRPAPPTHFMASDSSLNRWGAIYKDQMISYAWPLEDRRHINIKELEAGLLAFKAFFKTEFDRQTTVELYLDNCCAVYTINKFGSSKNMILNDLASQLWHSAIEKNIFIRAVYIPGKLNVEADWASRYFEDRSDWKLARPVFERLEGLFGPLTIDLFASFHNKQISVYYSWFPDPGALAVDAFEQHWPRTGAYAFPPINLIARVLQVVVQQECSLLLIAPCWPHQPWFPLLLQLLSDDPRSLSHNLDLLQHPRGLIHPMLRAQSLHLTAWPLSGQQVKQNNYRQRLQNLSTTPFARRQDVHMTPAGSDGWIGVIQNKRIQTILL